MNAPLKFKPVDAAEDVAARIPNRPVVDAAIFQATCEEQRAAIADELGTVNADMLALRDKVAANEQRIKALMAENERYSDGIASLESRRIDLLELDGIKADEYQAYEAQLRRKAGQ